jgi:hypothetical protein
MKIAKANVEYALALVDVLVSITAKILDAAAKVGTVITIPFAIEELDKTPGFALEKGFKVLSELGKRFVDSVSDARDIVTQVGDHSKLPQGRWPEAVYG